MATPARYIEVWTERTDTTRSQAHRVARALQTAGQNQMGNQGGGKSAVHWHEGDSMRLAVGIAVADPATMAAEIVPRYEGLSFFKRTAEVPHFVDGKVLGWTPYTSKSRNGLSFNPLAVPNGSAIGADLGLSCDRLGDEIANQIKRAASDPAHVAALHKADMRVGLLMGHPAAFINFIAPDGTRVTDHYVRQDSTSEGDGRRRAARIQKTAYLSSYTFEMLADLLRDTWEHQGRLPLAPTGSSSSSNTPPGDDPGPTNENGAALPGATPSIRKPTRNKNRRNTAAPGLNNREATEGLAECQASCGGGQLHAGDSVRTFDRNPSAWSARYDLSESHPPRPSVG